MSTYGPSARSRSGPVGGGVRTVLVALLLGSTAAGQQVVAELELEAPEADTFVLHGTVPVPRHTLTDDGPDAPLAILAPDGSPLPTQVERVSGYADAASGADVVELIARVQRPAGAQPGDRVRYEVAHQDAPQPDLQLHPAVEELLATDGALQLRTKDVFGHDYAADLRRDLDAEAPRLRRDGPVVRELVAHEVALPELPVEGSLGTLHHQVGVHAWLRVFDQEGFVLLDLHVHNGMDGRDPVDPSDDLIDRLYFQELALRLPPAWRVLHAFDHPGTGEQRPAGLLTDHLLLQYRGGKVHLMPRQARMVRRVALALPGYEERARAALEERGLAFARKGPAPPGELWSWWNAETARYFPQRQRLPDLEHLGLATLQDQLAAELAEHEAQLAAGASGDYPFLSQLLGWAHPWGVMYGGMSGGDEIHPWDGLRTAAAASREGYRLAQLVTRAYSDRQPTALYGVDGRHMRVEDILAPGPSGPYAISSFHLLPSSGFGFEEAPRFQEAAVRALGLNPRWHEVLERFQPIDLQHYVRYTRNLKILCWLGNDSLARHLLLSAAEVFHLSFHRYPVGEWGWVPGWGLLAKQQQVTQDPGEGVGLGREHAWGIDCAAAAYSVADEEWRASKQEWFRTIVRVVEEGQSSCTGNIMSAWLGHKALDGRFLVRRTNESVYLDHALAGLGESVLKGAFPDRARVLDDALVASVSAGVRAPYWSEKHQAVWIQVGVSAADFAFPEFCLDVPRSAFDRELGVTTEHSWSSLVYGYERTGDPFFLQRAAALSGGQLWYELHEAGQHNLEERAAMLALIQSVGDHY